MFLKNESMYPEVEVWKSFSQLESLVMYIEKVKEFQAQNKKILFYALFNGNTST